MGLEYFWKEKIEVCSQLPCCCRQQHFNSTLSTELQEKRRKHLTGDTNLLFLKMWDLTWWHTERWLSVIPVIICQINNTTTTTTTTATTTTTTKKHSTGHLWANLTFLGKCSTWNHANWQVGTRGKLLTSYFPLVGTDYVKQGVAMHLNTWRARETPE